MHVNDLRPSVFSLKALYDNVWYRFLIRVKNISIRNYRCMYYLRLLRSWSGNGDWKYLYSNLERWWDSEKEQQRQQLLLAQEEDRRREEMRLEALRQESFFSRGFPFEYVSFLSKSKLVLSSFPAKVSMLPHCAVLQSTTRSPPACSGKTLRLCFEALTMPHRADVDLCQ